MKKPVLVVMAAGMGSRYGGLKQIDPIDKEGHIIMDFSIYDAVKAGFEKVVFIIKKENEEDFRKAIGDRLSKQIQVAYVFQDLHNIPEGYEVPADRVKPWGTGHAVLSCIGEVDGPFAVINADDYYGSHAFKMAYDFLTENQDEEELYKYMMVGYKLENTLTDNGHVARGVCVTDENDHLIKINERTHIEKHNGGTAYTEDDGATWTMLPEGSTVSMNMWGFSASILTELKARFAAFLDENLSKNPLKCEYFLPFVVDELLHEKKATVTVLKSEDKWYGVTYKDDKPFVMAAIQNLKDQGLYPQNLSGGEQITVNAIQKEVISKFDFPGEVVECIPYGSGHINDTYRLTVHTPGGQDKRFILQRMNKSIFTKPVELMENVSGVTSWLRKKIQENGGDVERETLNIVNDKDNNPYYVDSEGEYWRVYLFIEDATSFDMVKDDNDFYQSAVAFGHFRDCWQTIRQKRCMRPL